MESRSNKKSSRRKIALAVAVSSVAIAILASVLLSKPEAMTDAVHQDSIPIDLPHESDVRTGIPMLEAVEMINHPETLYFHPIKEGEHEYLWRAVDKGATFLSDNEMETYFTSFYGKGWRFAMQTADATKFYRMTYFEPPISVDTHWIKIFAFDDHRQDAKLLSDLDKIRLAPALDDPYGWVSVDEETALSINTLIETEGQYFRSVIRMGEVEGDASFRLMYLGPFSEELKQPEFQAMYNEVEAGH